MSYCSYIRRVSIDNCRIIISRRLANAPYPLEEEEFDAPLWNTSITRSVQGYKNSSLFSLEYQNIIGSFTVTEDNEIQYYVAGASTPYTDGEDLMNQIRAQQAACSLP